LREAALRALDATIRISMEAVVRPEWASPLIVGVHIREFRSALPEEETRQVVGVLRDDPELVAFLARHPLGRLEFSPGSLDHRWRASYDLAYDIVESLLRQAWRL
jgi:hypothetical protein